MPREDAVARVVADLKHGHTHTATQRLRTLLATDPSDTSLRCLLAQAYRQSGNLVEAGRWAYLTDELRPEEQEAFEHAHRSPWLRLRVLRYGGDPRALPAAGRQRLETLVRQAELEGPPDRAVGRAPVAPSIEPVQRSIRLPCLVVVLGILVSAILLAIGVYRFFAFLNTI